MEAQFRLIDQDRRREQLRRLHEECGQAHETQRSVREGRSVHVNIGILLFPLQLNLVGAQPRRAENEIVEERRSQADRLNDLPVMRRMALPQPVEERGEVGGVGSQCLVVVDVARLLNLGGLSRVVEVVDPPVPHDLQHVVDHRELCELLQSALFVATPEVLEVWLAEVLALEQADLFLEDQGVPRRGREHAFVGVDPERQLDVDPVSGLMPEVQECVRPASFADERLKMPFHQLIEHPEGRNKIRLPRTVSPDQNVEQAEFRLRLADGFEAPKSNAVELTHTLSCSGVLARHARVYHLPSFT